MPASLDVNDVVGKRICIGGIDINLIGRMSDKYFEDIENRTHEFAFFVSVIKNILNNSGCLIDVGANIGVTSSLMAKIRPNDTVYAIEPSSKSFNDLIKTINKNKFNNIRPINMGLGATPGRMNLNEDPFNSSAANFSTENLLEDDDPHGISVQRLDDFCSSYDIRPHFLKIDVEGFELNVLKGGLRVIGECSPIVFIEMNSFTTLAYGRTNPLDVLDFLRKHFDQILWIKNCELQSMKSDVQLIDFLHMHYLRNSGIDDLLCIPYGVPINIEALRSDIRNFRPELSAAAGARHQAILNSTTWRMAKNIQRLARPLKAIERLATSFKSMGRKRL